jgi:hypothetical protein
MQCHNPLDRWIHASLRAMGGPSSKSRREEYVATEDARPACGGLTPGRDRY